MEKQREPQEMTMAFRPYDLQEAFFVPGTHAYQSVGLWHRRRARGGAAAGLLRGGELAPATGPDDLRQRAAAPPDELPSAGSGPGGVHMALLMVAKAAERGGARSAPSVRLVQDFGCPDSPAALASATIAPLAQAVEVAPIKRGRGRPPGSRTRKNGTLQTVLVN